MDLEFIRDQPFTLMGVLNCTPDSFSDGCDQGADLRLERALEMVKEGAAIIDVGGESTRPGAEPVGEAEEIDRVAPVIESLAKASPHSWISSDTQKSAVAKVALELGAHMVNDVSAGSDPAMAQLVASKNCSVVLMHMQGVPKTMQDSPIYLHALQEVEAHLKAQTQVFVQAGTDPKRIFWDPGIGFGKALDHNLELMAGLDRLNRQHPVLLGVSRKSFIHHVDKSASNPLSRLGGSLAPLAIALQSGVGFFRVHDVAQTRQFCQVHSAITEKRDDPSRS